MCPWLIPFVACLYAFPKIKPFFGNCKNIGEYELRVCELFLQTPRFIAPGTYLRIVLKIEIYTGDRDRFPPGGIMNLESGTGVGGILAISGEVGEFSL